MNTRFRQAMRRATALTRAGNLTGASALIRAALTPGAVPAADPVATVQEPDTLAPDTLAPDTLAPDIPAPDMPTPRRRPIRPNGPIEEAQILSESVGRGGQGGPARRPSLGEAVAALRTGKAALKARQHTPRVPRRAAPMPQNARFENRTFRCAAGARDYVVYVPASVADQPKGLIIMLHGCQQTAEDFAAGTRMNFHAESHGFIVAYPSQTSAANLSSCWNWFQPGDQKRGGGEPAIIAGITTALMAEFHTSRDSTFIAGLSAGAAMAVIMGQSYPELFDAAGIHSGLAYRSAKDLNSAFSAMRGQGGSASHANLKGKPFVRTIVVHGTADATVHPSNGDAVLADARRATAKGSTARSENGKTNGRSFARTAVLGPQGERLVEDWRITGAGHAWSGGCATGSYTDAAGPDASAAMVDFFFARTAGAKARD